MQNMKWWTTASATLVAFVICATVTVPAHAFHWFWQKNPAPAAAQPSPTPAAAPAVNAAPATQASAPAAVPAPAMTSTPAKAESSRVMGTVESIDPASGRLSLKTRSGKSESFMLAKSSMIFEHHKQLTVSALKAGERVSVHYRSGSSEATRVYVLEKKA